MALVGGLAAVWRRPEGVARRGEDCDRSHHGSCWSAAPTSTPPTSRADTVACGAAIGANGVVRFLVERGARLDAKTRQGRTPLDEALRGVANIDGAPGEGHEDTAALMRELMAQRGIAVPAVRAAAIAVPAEP